MVVIEKRSVGMAILLSIITCGIYLIYWEYKVWDSLYKANNLPSSAGVDVLLSIVTCGIYMFYMLYKAGKMESSAMALYGLPPKDDSVLYLILGIFALAIVSLAILQSNINNTLADVVNGSYNDPQQRQQ
jgi:ABC-type dipeptide/oligopeptide/nickel transport system permease component